MKIQRKIFSLLLAVYLIVRLIPMVSFAAGTVTSTDKAIQLVNSDNSTGGISGYDKNSSSYDYIYYGTWNSSPIKWRVLDDKTNFDSNGDGTNEAGLFLLSDALIENEVFFNGSLPEEYNNRWQGSLAQKWCKDFAGIDGSDVTDAFSATELAAILATTKSDSQYNPYFVASDSILNGDKVFFLSAEEVGEDEYGFTSANARIAYSNGIAKRWWLRSPCTSYEQVGVVDDAGYFMEQVVLSVMAARPAFNLNLNSVLFTSAAKGGKSATDMDSGLTAISSYSGSEWKLTLSDSSRDSFDAEFVKTSTSTFIAYTDAQTGSNEYISALITNNSGAVTYYGRLKNLTESSDASGTAEIDLSGITMESGDMLYIFNEQYNGDYKTDYSSALKEVTVLTTANAYDITNNLTNVSISNTDTYRLARNSTDYTATLAAADGYILPESITVTVGGTTLGNGDYTYNSATGELRIIANNITGNIVIAAEGVACTYTLSVTAPTFADVTYGYTQPDAASITIISTGNSDATISNVTANPEYFTIGDGENTVTAGDSITTWTIQPVSGLGAGEYTDTITVTYNNGATAKANVSFTVGKATPSVTAPTSKTNLVYTGNAQELVNTSSTTGGTMYYRLDNSVWSTDVPTGTDADDYTVYYKVVGDSNHNDFTPVNNSVSVTIGKAEQSISYSAGSVSKHINDAAFINELTKATVGGEISYASNDTGVATVDEDGKVTIVGAGTATITATAAATENYNEATASYTLTVTDHSYTATTIDPTYTEQGYTLHTCDICGDSYQTDSTDILVLDGTDSNVSTKTTVQSLTTLPEGLKNLYSSVNELISDLISRVTVGAGYTADNALVYDVVLQYSTDGGTTWITATVYNFPADGITVTLPYPDGMDSSYEFTVLHMFTVDSDRLGILAGGTETPTITKTDDGLVVTLTGLSPVAIAWKTVTTSTTETETINTSGTSASSTTSAQTGDETNILLWIVVMLLAVSGITVIGICGRKRKCDR